MKRLIIIIFLFVFSSAAIAQFKGMSDEELDRIMSDTAYINKLYAVVLIKNPTNRIYESRIKIAEDEVSIQKWSWLNFLGISFTYYPGFLNPTQENTNSIIDYRVGLGVYLNFGSLFNVPRTIAQSKEKLKIEEYNLEGQRYFLKAETIRRFAAYITAIKMLKIKSRAVNDASETVYMAKIKFDKGEETLENYNSSLSALTYTLVEKAKGEAEIVGTKASLEEFLGTALEEIK